MSLSYCCPIAAVELYSHVLGHYAARQCTGMVLGARTVSVKKSRLTGLKVKRSSQVNLRSVVMQVPC
jgi:hypothetical protein